MQMARRRARQDYSHRAVYVDHLGLYAWYVDSHGRRSKDYPIMPGERPEDVANKLQMWLDQVDPIPSDDFRPAPLTGRHLRLL